MRKMFWLEKWYFRTFYPDILKPFEKKVYSQNGEDGVIEELLQRIGTDSKFGVEFGVEDGTECNSRLLIEKGWNVLQMDGNDDNPPSIKQEFITAENINKLFNKYNVPENLDFLCVDIDFNDYWVFKALSDKYKPRLLVMEYNGSVSPLESKTVAYDAKRMWNKTDYYGASLRALYKIAKKKGYSLVYCEERGVNAFFVRNDLLNKSLVAKRPSQVYKAPNYGMPEGDEELGHPHSKEKMVEV